MLNVVYLVLVITWASGTETVSIPQANMKQCQVNASNQIKSNAVNSAKCIVGVMPK